jgi:hypothetical protein
MFGEAATEVVRPRAPVRCDDESRVGLTVGNCRVHAAGTKQLLACAQNP